METNSTGLPAAPPGPESEPVPAAPPVLAGPRLPVADSVADGVERPVDPRAILLNRMVTAIVAASILSGELFALLIVAVSARPPLWVLGLASAGWLATLGLFLWLVVVWPTLHHRHQAYRVGAGRIEIRSGVFWRRIVSVPRSRIQHIDVAQGPIQRHLGLAKLILHTAGTDNAQVELDGLAHETALRIRDHLVSGGPDDAL